MRDARGVTGRTLGVRSYMRVQNLHGLALSGLPLGVACTRCGHRALIEAAKVGARDGNMTEIRQLKLRCTECDGTAFEGTIFSAQSQVDDFFAVLSWKHCRPMLSTAFPSMGRLPCFPGNRCNCCRSHCTSLSPTR